MAADQPMADIDVQPSDAASGRAGPTDAILRQAVDAAPDGILVADDGGVIVYVNPMLLEQFGYTSDELLGAPVETLLPEALRSRHVDHRATYHDRPRTRPMGSGLDLQGRRRDGVEFPVEIGLSPIAAGGRRYVIAIVRDVTERRKAAAELMHAQEELALVEDRERIARDLHDTVIQRLFAVGLSLQGLLTRASNPELADRIEAAIDEIDGTIRDIRTAIFSLHARRLTPAGTRDDVIAVVRDAARALGFEPSVTFDGLVDTAMPDAVREHLLPTLREALTNVAKHAHATRASVHLTVTDGEVRLTVADNGIGFEANTDHAGRGLGNIAERATALGGTCEIRGSEPSGTHVEWTVPRRPSRT